MTPMRARGGSFFLALRLRRLCLAGKKVYPMPPVELLPFYQCQLWWWIGRKVCTCVTCKRRKAHVLNYKSNPCSATKRPVVALQPFVKPFLVLAEARIMDGPFSIYAGLLARSGSRSQTLNHYWRTQHLDPAGVVSV